MTMSSGIVIIAVYWSETGEWVVKDRRPAACWFTFAFIVKETYDS